MIRNTIRVKIAGLWHYTGVEYPMEGLIRVLERLQLKWKDLEGQDILVELGNEYTGYNKIGTIKLEQ